MSLNRVASLESVAFLPGRPSSRRSSDASSVPVSLLVSDGARSRRLSFNPLPDAWDPIDTRTDMVQAVSAFEVPVWKRIAQIVVTVVYCFFAAGIVFGYAAIKPVLKKEGAYRDVCIAAGGRDPSVAAAAAAAADDDNNVDTCVEIHLNFMFTVAAVGTNVAALPLGALLDHAGPRACGLLGAAFLAAGALLLAHAPLPPTTPLPVDAYLCGYLLLALGGPCTYISAFQLSNAFPRHAGLILALLTGAFDASSAVFLGYRVLYERSDGAFGHGAFFRWYLVVPALIALLQLTLLPRQSYKTVGALVAQAARLEEEEEERDDEAGDPDPLSARRVPPTAPNHRHRPAADQIDEHTALLQDEAQARARRASVVADIEALLGSAKADTQVRREEATNEIAGVWGVLHDQPALAQIRSPWFVLICLFTVIQMTRINYFVATVRPQYEALLGSPAQAVAVNHFFDLALPLGGLVAIPLVGLVLDRTPTVTVLAALVVGATAVGALGVVPHRPWAAYANVLLFVLYRPFYYTAVSDYSAKVFGFRTFGTVYGTIICLAGLGNFAQSGLDYLFHQVCGGNPVPVNLLLLVLGLFVGVCLVAFVRAHGRGGWRPETAALDG
ncbi:major facilitator superfamily transporter [Niveomyces insectorum RCEF 264]|uniref:Major facilitator superfamily transporter n=1 Tax=Niveomyces insectorum RCEF 264 TaxID=1081102 RepID=A0A167U5V8_9HYPO|nr:major facilitator superfamily transporter [Niveomyces insectorum RCEF 264]